MDGTYWGGISIMVLTVAPLLIFFAWLAFKASVRASSKRQADRVMARLAEQDPTWDLEQIRQAGREAFTRMIAIETPEALPTATPVITRRMWKERNRYLSWYRENGAERRFSGLDLISLEVVTIEDRRDDRQDRVCLYAHYAAEDFTYFPDVSLYTAGHTFPSIHPKYQYSEPPMVGTYDCLLTLVREDGTWLLDEVDFNPEVALLRSQNSFSEALDQPRGG